MTYFWTTFIWRRLIYINMIIICCDRYKVRDRTKELYELRPRNDSEKLIPNVTIFQPCL